MSSVHADDVGDLLQVRPVSVPFGLARAAADVTWRLRLHPLSPGAAGPGPPVPAAGRHTGPRGARLGAGTHRTSALAAVLAGIGSDTGAATPTLHPDRTDRDLVDELGTGQGQVDSRSTAPPSRTGRP